MGNVIPDKKLITDTAGLIQHESIELIDFDKLGDVLASLCNILDNYRHVQSELNTIKADYCNRILGMYRKAAARFRNNFPASFKYITSGEANHLKDGWEYHKI